MNQAPPASTTKGLFKSTSLVAAMTFISRLLGFVRDMVIAHLFGAAAGMDAFLVAFKIPNFMRRLFAEGAFAQAFVPVLSEYREQRGHAEVNAFIGNMLGTLGLILFVVSVLAIIAAPILISLFAPGFAHGMPRFAMASAMLRITFPYLLFISLTAFAGAALNCYGVFGPPAFTPVLLNVCLIVAAIFFAPLFAHPIEALAWGVLVAGLAQLLFQIPFLYRKRLLARPRVSWRDAGVMRVMRLMVPALFGVSVAQISLLLDTVFASFLVVGSVSWLYYSERLMMFPLGVIGVALSTVILPHLSRKHAAHAPQEYSNTLDWAIRCALSIGVPAAIGLGILAGPLMASLFGYGQFDAHDVLMARLSLMAFSVGVPAFMLIKILAAGFYARQNIKTPVRIAAVSLFVNMCLNLALILPLAHAGLALATSLSACLNAGLLFKQLRVKQIFIPQLGWARFFLRLVFANTALAVFLWWFKGGIDTWLMWHWAARAEHLILLVGGGMCIYLGSLFVIGMRPQHFRVNRQLA